jgi:diguanylate cyclase
MPPAVRAVRTAAVIGTAAMVVMALLGVRLTGSEQVAQGVAYAVIVIAAAVGCLARARLDRAERWPWALLGAAIGSWGAGMALWTLAGSPGAALAFPSVADLLFSAFYPLAYTGVALLVRARVQGFIASTLLDGLIAGLALSAVVAEVVLDHLVAAGGGTRGEVAMSLAWPLGDLGLLVLLCVGLAASGRRASPGMRRLIAGLLVLLASDAAYVQQAAGSSYAFGSLVSAGWLIGMGLLAAAARRPAPQDASKERRAVLLAPVLAAGLALALLVPDGVNGVATALAAGAVALAGLRLLLSVREVAELAVQGREARTDDLTGLPNRRAFTEGIAGAIHKAAGQPFAVLLIDLDGFRELNDTLGHHMGDGLLRHVGARLSAVRRPGDLLARLGGDEYGLLTAPGTTREQAEALAREARAVLEDPFVLAGVPVHADGSIGIAVHPDHAADAAELLRHVDIAMYRAKRGRLGVATFAPDLDVHSRDRLELLGELRRGISSGQLVLHFQPKIRMGDGTVDGFEALVRWEHPERGLLFPDAFVDVVEQTSLLAPMTVQVIEQALAHCATLEGAGVAVNVSSASLSDPELVGAVEAALAHWGIAGSRLTVEITESAIIGDLPRAVALLERLRALGVRIAIDDYGTGHSSLAYLHRLPADELKIDRAFIADLDSDPRRAAIVRSTIELARDLGLCVVAEGVETEAAWRMLATLGCDMAQGYLIARPADPCASAAWLTGWRTSPPAWAARAHARVGR